jgi:ParB family chromosome partitioning protein
MVDKKIKLREIKEVNLDLIDISEENVRKEKQRENLEELKTSVQRIGLIHPVILISKKDGRYELVAGQRRLLVFEQLKQKSIPAIIVNDLDALSKKILSFTENIHRRDLPYADTIRICDELFNSYKGSEKQKIDKISKEIGISPETVAKYLAYRLVPKKVQNMVEDGKISANAAYKITTAFWPNDEKIEKIAEYASNVTNTTWSRALDIGKRKPKASIKEIIEESAKPIQQLKIAVTFAPETLKILQERAEEIGKVEKRKISIKELIMKIIEEYLSKE